MNVFRSFVLVVAPRNLIADGAKGAHLRVGRVASGTEIDTGGFVSIRRGMPQSDDVKIQKTSGLFTTAVEEYPCANGGRISKCSFMMSGPRRKDWY